jgi:hypothetical protein
MKGRYGCTVSDHADYQRGDDRLFVLRVAAAGEVLTIAGTEF